MLVECPECGRSVSSRANACPGCGFPIAEQLVEDARKARLEAARSQRREVGEVDCPHCEARGFTLFEYVTREGEKRNGFDWCRYCEHSGRLALCEDPEGFYAVVRSALSEFLAGERDADGDFVRYLGAEPPEGHRYPHAGPKHSDDEAS